MSTGARELAEQGFTLLEGLMSPELIEALSRRVDELFLEEGDRAGWEFRQEPEAETPQEIRHLLSLRTP